MAAITVSEHCQVEGTVFNKSVKTAGKSDKGAYSYFFFDLEDASGVLKVSAYDKFDNESIFFNQSF